MRLSTVRTTAISLVVFAVALSVPKTIRLNEILVVGAPVADILCFCYLSVWVIFIAWAIYDLGYKHGNEQKEFDTRRK